MTKHARRETDAEFDLRNHASAQSRVAGDLLDILRGRGKSLVRHFPSTGEKIVVLFTKELWLVEDDGDNQLHHVASVELTPAKVRALVDAYEDSLGETQYLTYQKGLPNSVPADFVHLNRPGLGQGIVDNNAGSWLERHGLANSRHQQYGPEQSFAGRRCGYKYYKLNSVGRRIGEYLSKEGA